MPRVVTKLTPKQTGGYSARKRIPADVREEYSRQFDKSSEEWFTTANDVSFATAKTLFHEWSAEIGSRFASIRAMRKGGGLALTRKQALALAGKWYGWFVKRHEDAPGDPARWWSRWSGLLDDLEELAPTAVRASADTIAVWNWLNSAEARPRVRPIIADEAQTAQFLASEGLVLSNEARDLFLDMVEEEFLAAVKLLERRAKRDYSPDTRIQTFPKFELDVPLSSEGLSPWQLFEAWVEKRKPAPATVTRWRGVFLDLDKHFAGRAAGSLKDDEAHAWATQLVTPKRTAATVAGVWLNAAHTVWIWAVEQRKVRTNAFASVKITIPKSTRTRDTKTFTPAEARTILKASLAIGDPGKSPSAAVRRWVPWLCSYTGARAGEITQLRGKDVLHQDGVPAIRVTPEAGTVKTREPRTIPLHEHLIAQGFLKFAKSKGEGPLFYNAKGIKQSDDPTHPSRPRAVTARVDLAAWVRSVGITDTAVSPNHAWRHTFKQIAERCGISERVSDYITGHAPATVSRGYGAPTLQDMAEVLKKFPRYELTQEGDEDGEEGKAKRKKPRDKAHSKVHPLHAR